MSARSGRWRVASRLARREVRRHPWRHLLVLVMIFVPVAGALAAFSAMSTWQDFDRLEGSYDRAPTGLAHWEPTRPPRDGDEDSPDLPPGATEVTRWTGGDWFVSDVARDDGDGPLLLPAEVIEASPGSVGAPAFVVDRGRLPERADEILLTRALAADGDWAIGDQVESAKSERRFEVVGIGQLGSNIDRPAAAVTGLDEAYWTTPVGGYSEVRLPDGDRYGEPWISIVGYQEQWFRPAPGQPVSSLGPDFVPTQPRLEVTTIVGPSITMAAAVLCTVVAVIASAAFALASRRQLRSIGLLATAGVDPATVRRAIVLQGAIPGLLAGLAAIALGLAVTTLEQQQRVLQELTGVLGARTVLSWPGAIVTLVLGTASGAAAAWQPARTATRVPVLSALAGRKPVGPVPTNIPLGGLALWGVGAILLGVGFGLDGRSAVSIVQPLLLFGGTIAFALGAVGLAPLGVAMLGPAADRCRGALRLALRGLSRHRTQSAATVAAMAVVLALPVGILTGRAVALQETVDATPESPEEATPLERIDQPTVLRPADEITQVVIAGNARGEAARAAIEQTQALLGPRSSVIPTLPIVDQDGAWRRVAVVDEAARAVFEPWVVDALDAGQAVALAGDEGELTLTAAGNSATFELATPPDDDGSGDLSWLDFGEVQFMVGPEQMAAIEEVRAPERLAVVRPGAPTAAELAVFDELEGLVEGASPVPTLEQVRAAVGDGRRPNQGEASITLVRNAPSSEESADAWTWARVFALLAAAATTVALLVLAVTLSLRAVDGRDDHLAALAAGLPPGRLRRQRAVEGTTLTALAAALAVPLGWIPVTAARIGATSLDEDPLPLLDRIALPGWELLVVLAAPIVAAAVLWTVFPALADGVRRLRHRGPVDVLAPRF